MPNLDNTKILKAIAKVEGEFSAPEFREGSNNTANLLFANEAQVFRNVNALKRSVNQPTEAILMARNSQTLGGNKEANHQAGAFEDSQVKGITYVPFTRKFKVSYKMAENNYFSYDEQLRMAMLNAFIDLREGINAYAVAQLSANKTQVAEGGTLMAFNATNFAYENLASATDLLASRTKSVLRKNKYNGNLDIVADQFVSEILQRTSAQGTQNATNQIWQFPNISMVEEETLDANAVGYGSGYGYAFSRGSVGMTSWNEGKNVNPSEDNNITGTTGMFTTVADPVIPNLTYDLHVKRGLADTVAGATTYRQDVVDEYELTAFVAFEKALISTADASPIFAIGQL